VTEGHGLPIAVILTGANRTDMKKLGDVLDAVVIERPWQAAQAAQTDTVAEPAAAGTTEGAAAGAPAVQEQVCLDRGFDYEECRAAARARGYEPHIPAKASKEQPLPAPGDPTRHPPRRWVVEVAHSWLNRFRRLLVRWEKDAANYLGFVQLAACLIIYRKLRHVRSLSG
jgi:transposase